ncbi:hypothetical protein [Effusibacillus dendaii]|uniref:Uncharacterized protein n=1 Tax=Effusibacillus dendaii TaxID=2743772 RepID=A0A7I8DEG0_9BACL|nr:hypothetical protein [Effusibacillus dendaii]BCJ88533.1 hypothetical protein skT53_35180 [Effusibacillus dendaii]
MLDATLLEKTCANYTEEQKDAIMKGFCPHCLPKLTPYRILNTFYSEQFEMMVHRVKCQDIVRCEWEELVPNRRSDNGLENFFHS